MSGQRWDCMSVTEYQSQGATKSKWTKIGAAFTNQDGSIGIQLDCLPLDGRIVLQVPLTYEQRQAKYGNRQQGGGYQQPQGGGGGRGGGGRGFGGARTVAQQQAYQQGQAPYEPEPPQQGGDDPGDESGGYNVPFR